MLGLCAAFLAGQCASAFLRVPGAAALGALALALISGGASPPLRRVSRLGAAAVLGGWFASRALEPPIGCFLPPEGVPTRAWLQGTVERDPVRFEDGLRLELDARAEIGTGEVPLCGLVRLSLEEAPGPLEVGARVRVHAHLRRPRNFLDPGAPDWAGSWARNGTWVTAWATPGTLRVLGHDPRGWRSALARARAAVAERIDRSAAPAEAALLRALVVGDTARVSEGVWRTLAEAGVAHLLSVSGLHVGIVWGSAFALVRAALSRSEWLLLSADVRGLAALAALVPASLYGLLAGGRIPTERAVWMVLLGVSAWGVGREARPLRLLALGALAVSLARPGAPLEVSFQLSFGAVLGLVLVGERRQRRATAADTGSRLRAMAFALGVAPAAALAATAPLTAFHFNRVSPIGLLTNPVLVPLLGAPATVLGLVGAGLVAVREEAAGAVFRLAGVLLRLFVSASAFAAGLPGASLRVPTPTLFELALSYGALALPWVVAAGRRRAVGAVLLVLGAGDAAFWARERLLRPDLLVRFLDVGQGDAAVVELPGGAVVVVDGGGFPRSRFDVGERVVARYLWTRKILRLEAIAATHADFDHRGGLHALAREFAPRELWRSRLASGASGLEPLERLVLEQGGRVRPLSAGEEAWRSGGVAIHCLHPPPEGRFSENDSSLVLRIAAGGVSVLLAGDVESGAEQRIPAPEAAVLKVPHHGSRTSSTPGFLARVRPRIAVFSVGSGNRYGLPDPDVLARYRALGAQILRTDLDGSVLVRARGSEIQVRPFSRASPVACSAFGLLC